MMTTGDQAGRGVASEEADTTWALGAVKAWGVVDAAVWATAIRDASDGKVLR
jgi:hypothetical protein